jgi:hypothetical protein
LKGRENFQTHFMGPAYQNLTRTHTHTHTHTHTTVD